MYLIPIAWMYVVLMMAIAEATSSQGSLLGAIITFLLYGALPLSIVMYVMRTPGRKRARQAEEQRQAQMSTAPAPDAASPSALDPNGRSHASGDPVTSERKEV